MVKIIGNDVMREGKKIGWIEGSHILDYHGERVGYFADEYVYTRDGHKIARIDGDYVYATSGDKRMRIEDMRANIVGGLISDIARVAIWLLLGN